MLKSTDLLDCAATHGQVVCPCHFHQPISGPRCCQQLNAILTRPFSGRLPEPLVENRPNFPKLSVYAILTVRNRRDTSTGLVENEMSYRYEILHADEACHDTWSSVPLPCQYNVAYKENAFLELANNCIRNSTEMKETVRRVDFLAITCD
ncbi:hypothetical protein J6590_042769 [Homalodisca vitripennis]|nr:hypothetical protein J6590_042769 [Homalodisca vitripennis]